MALMQVDTYDVIPVSPALGLMAFVPGTMPLIDAFCVSDRLDDQATQHNALVCQLAKQKVGEV